MFVLEFYVWLASELFQKCDEDLREQINFFMSIFRYRCQKALHKEPGRAHTSTLISPTQAQLAALWLNLPVKRSKPIELPFDGSKSKEIETS